MLNVRRLFQSALRISTVLSLVAGLCQPTLALQAQAKPTVRQFRTDSFYIREWIRGGVKEPDVLVEPREIAVTQNAVIVLDAGTREVHALDLRNGRTRFVLKATGEGPGEFKRPTHIATTTHLVGVLDQATSRITVYSDSGRYLWTTTVPDGSSVEAMCMLPRGVLRVKYAGAVSALATIDSTGRILWRSSLPTKPELQKAPTFANSAFLADGCAEGVMTVAPSFGASWYRVTMRGATRRFSYVEAGRDAVITLKKQTVDQTPAAKAERIIQTTGVDAITRGAMQRGDTIIVEAGATKRLPYELIDYYRASDGAYLYSRHLPFTPSALAITPDGQLLAAFIGNETSSIVQLSTTTLTPREIAKLKSRK
ncbi:6-bladed beta-propeller [Gemmatimonas sp.]|uniref:6-bladed beta-propeller n=1 Tax=Gemmatimonas sp. TaxID=1962908 RepID=UPI003564CE8F